MARIAIARPHGRQGGNLTTALRWQRILTDLGHQVSLAEGWREGLRAPWRGPGFNANFTRNKM